MKSACSSRGSLVSYHGAVWRASSGREPAEPALISGMLHLRKIEYGSRGLLSEACRVSLSQATQRADRRVLRISRPACSQPFLHAADHQHRRSHLRGRRSARPAWADSCLAHAGNPFVVHLSPRARGHGGRATLRARRWGRCLNPQAPNSVIVARAPGEVVAPRRRRPAHCNAKRFAQVRSPRSAAAAAACDGNSAPGHQHPQLLSAPNDELMTAHPKRRDFCPIDSAEESEACAGRLATR